MTTTRIVVLNDGETFTNAAGCTVYDVNADATTEEIEEALSGLERMKQIANSVVLTEPLSHLVAQFDNTGRLIVS